MHEVERVERDRVDTTRDDGKKLFSFVGAFSCDKRCEMCVRDQN